MLDKLCHIILSHLTRKLCFPWTSVFHLQLHDPELMGSGAEGLSLPQSVTLLGCLLCPLFFLQQDIFLYWILHCKVRTMLQRGMIRQQGSRWPSMGNTGRGDQQSCTRGSLAALAAKQVPCVKGVSLSHLWEDSNQCCKTSSQILFGIRSMLGWSSDSLFKASFTLFIFISTKDTLLTSFSAI